MRAAVLRPRRLVMTRIERTLFAVAHRAHARGVDAERGEVFLRDVRALVAEGEVVLLRAALVAVPFDEEVVRLAVALQPVRGAGQRRLRLGAERRFVIAEKGVLDIAVRLRVAV